jgi:hypothetical protein
LYSSPCIVRIKEDEIGWTCSMHAREGGERIKEDEICWTCSMHAREGGERERGDIGTVFG